MRVQGRVFFHPHRFLLPRHLGACLFSRRSGNRGCLLITCAITYMTFRAEDAQNRVSCSPGLKNDDRDAPCLRSANDLTPDPWPPLTPARPSRGTRTGQTKQETFRGPHEWRLEALRIQGVGDRDGPFWTADEAFMHDMVGDA